MFDWLTGTTLPQFWKSYLSLFEDTSGQEREKRFVVFDLEASGSDAKEGLILSIAAMGIKGSAISIGDFFEVQLHHNVIPKKGNAAADTDTVVEAEAVIRFLKFAADATLVSHSSNLDIEMINNALKRLDLGRLKNDFMDINVLYQKWKGLGDDHVATFDEMCQALHIDKSDRHTAAGNAYTAALIFLKLKKKLGL